MNSFEQIIHANYTSEELLSGVDKFGIMDDLLADYINQPEESSYENLEYIQENENTPVGVLDTQNHDPVSIFGSMLDDHLSDNHDSTNLVTHINNHQDDNDQSNQTFDHIAEQKTWDNQPDSIFKAMLNDALGYNSSANDFSRANDQPDGEQNDIFKTMLKEGLSNRSQAKNNQTTSTTNHNSTNGSHVQATQVDTSQSQTNKNIFSKINNLKLKLAAKLGNYALSTYEKAKKHPKLSTVVGIGSLVVAAGIAHYGFNIFDAHHNEIIHRASLNNNVSNNNPWTTKNTTISDKVGKVTFKSSISVKK